MNSLLPQKNTKGFTLIETVIAIFILSLTIGALLTLAASGIFSVRYARNQIVADNLLQESMEYLHNSRDSIAQQGGTWDDFIQSLNANTAGATAPYDAANPLGCFRDDGCVIDPFASRPIRQCGSSCQYISYYPDFGFYAYDSIYPFGTSQSIQTTYVQTITARLLTDPNQLMVTAKITWLNGLSPKTVQHTMILTNWHI